MQENYQIRIKELPEDQKPREKLIKYGPDVLRNSELLSIVLNTGYKGLNVIELSERIIKDYGSKAIAQERDVGRLMETLGIPQVKAWIKPLELLSPPMVSSVLRYAWVFQAQIDQTLLTERRLKWLSPRGLLA